MSPWSAQHRAVLEELTEWWEDVCEGDIGSRVVLVPVPPGWGRSSVLKEFGRVVEDLDGPVTFAVSIKPVPLVSRADQAQALREALMTAGMRSRVAELFGLDSAAGEVQLSLSVGSLFMSGLAVAAAVLIASLAVTAVGNAWDGSPAGEQGAVARAARAVAAVSVSAPVVVIIDNADCLDPGLAVTMIENLASRHHGRVLVVAIVTLASELAARLSSPSRYEMLGHVRYVDVIPDMSYGSRVALARETSPDLADAAVERIARRTRTFKEVFTVTAADKMAELAQETDPTALLAAVDAVIDATLERGKPSTEATILAWAGGALYVSQADRALQVVGADRHEDDPWVIRSEGLARLADPASARLTEQVAALAARTRHQLAAAVLDEAINIARDPDATLTERVIAWQAAHHVRADLDTRSELTSVQSMLIRGLERLGDPEGAYDVVTAGLAELPATDQNDKERLELMKAVLRLARTRPRQDDDPLIEQAVTLATTSGALLGLEARIWAAVDLLDRPGHREAARELTDQVTDELANHPSRDATANQWRLLLAFHAGRAGYPAISQRLLTSMINTGTIDQQEAARAVLRAVGGHQTDTRLQIIILDAELAATPPGADDELLRLHSTLAANYDTMGDYSKALQHGNDELALRRRLQGPDHLQTLTARSQIAERTGMCGNTAEGLRLFKELLADEVRVQGPGHPDVLHTRASVAAWTGECGDRSEALRLYKELLPDQVRVDGRDHPDVLSTRANIANYTIDSAEALHLFKELLPDRIRVQGPDHPGVLTTRNNIAYLTGRRENSAEALRLFKELLADRVRVQGPDHPSTLNTRANVAEWTGRCGNRAEAVRLYEDLLSDEVRVQGANHPDVQITRAYIGFWSLDLVRNSAEALRLHEELLPGQVGPEPWPAGPAPMLRSQVTLAQMTPGPGPRLSPPPIRTPPATSAVAVLNIKARHRYSR